MKKIPPDKWKHFFVGIALGALLQYSSWRFFPTHHVSATIVALIALMAICYGFELFSKITGLGYYDIMDAVAGIIGGIFGMTLILISKAF